MGELILHSQGKINCYGNLCGKPDEIVAQIPLVLGPSTGCFEKFSFGMMMMMTSELSNIRAAISVLRGHSKTIIEEMMIMSHAV
jgi:hypothetical protein